jgi:hypothetical protein
MSIRPKTTFNGFENREKFLLSGLEILVTGANPVLWELCVGQAVTTPSYADINATYSAYEYDTAGILSGSPAIVISSGYVPSSSQTKGTFSGDIATRYPITLDASGAVRALGTLTLLVTGLGGVSACRASILYNEGR